MTYPVFFELVSAHAKTLDQQEWSSSEAKCNANQTQRQQQPQKSNKKDKKQIPPDERIIWKNNPFVKLKGEFKKLSEDEQKALLRKAIDWSKKKKASDKEDNSDRSNTGNNDQVWEEVPATGTHVCFAHQTVTSTSNSLPE